MAKVVTRLGTVTYLVQEGQRQRTEHVDHMLPWRVTPMNPPVELCVQVAERLPPAKMGNAVPVVLPSTPVSQTAPAVLPKPTEQTVEVSPASVTATVSVIDAHRD